MSNQIVLLSSEEVSFRAIDRENRNSFGEYEKSYEKGLISFSRNLAVSSDVRTDENSGILSGIFDFFSNLSKNWERFLNNLYSPVYDFINYYKPKFETMLDFLKSTKTLIIDIKEQAIRLSTNFGANNLTGAFGWDRDVLFADGYFVKLIKYNFKKVRETVTKSFDDSVKFILKSVDLSKFFAVSSSYDSGHFGFNDGVFTKLFKGQIGRVLSVFDVGIGFLDSPNASSGDSPFVVFFRKQIGGIVSSVRSVDEKLKKYFSADVFLYDSGTIRSEDGFLVRVLKGQTTRVVSVLEKLSSFLREYFFSTYSTAVRDVIKSVNAVENAIKKIKFDVDLGGVGGSSAGWLDSLMKAIGSVLEATIKALGDVLSKTIENGFKTLETFLNELGASLRAVIDFLKSFYGKMIELIVPRNMDFVTKKIDSLKVKFKAKFSFFFDWVDTFKGLLLDNQKEFSDVTIS
ncbi:hypothetical protein, partial [Enterococcus faecalis]|uniref:hypothetical protein n=1 Tax=Enterococcus faecalis TaxID=1351 RepID=UPI001A95D42B